MAFLTQSRLEAMGFKHLGKNVKISDRASIYGAEKMSIGDNSRIDDFCMLSGCITLENNIHITPFCNLSAAKEPLLIENFVTLAFGAYILSGSDDYSGASLTGATVPYKYRNLIDSPTTIKKHCIVGMKSAVMPGVTLAEGTSIGAMSLVTKDTQPWTIYVGIPAKAVKARKKDMLEMEKKYLDES